MNIAYWKLKHQRFYATLYSFRYHILSTPAFLSEVQFCVHISHYYFLVPLTVLKGALDVTDSV